MDGSKPMEMPLFHLPQIKPTRYFDVAVKTTTSMAAAARLEVPKPIRKMNDSVLRILTDACEPLVHTESLFP